MVEKDTKTLVAEKVKKLLRLSKSSNEHEAALATEKVQEILTKYGMSLTDVEIETAEIVENKIKTKFKKTPKWVYQLGGTVAENTYCDLFVSSLAVNFIGTVQDTKVAEYLFDYLYKVVKTMTKTYTKSYYNRVPLHDLIQINYSYASGVVLTILMKLKSSREQRKQKSVVTVNGTELVVVKNAAIKNYNEKNMQHCRPVNIGNTNVNRGAYLQGVVDGKSVSIHQAVTKSTTKNQQRLEVNKSV